MNKAGTFNKLPLFFLREGMLLILRQSQNSTSIFYIKHPEKVKNYNHDPIGHLPPLDMETKLLHSPKIAYETTNHKPCPSKLIIRHQTLGSCKRCSGREHSCRIHHFGPSTRRTAPKRLESHHQHRRQGDPAPKHPNRRR